MSKTEFKDSVAESYVKRPGQKAAKRNGTGQLDEPVEGVKPATPSKDKDNVYLRIIDGGR